MEMWLKLINSLAFGYVANRVTNWAKNRWGLSDPPWWIWALIFWGGMLYQVYVQGASAWGSIGYFFLSILIMGGLIAAFMWRPARRQE